MRTCPVCGWRSDSTAGHLCRLPEPAHASPERSTFTVTLSPGFFFGDERYTNLMAALTAQRQRREDAKVRALYVGGWAKAHAVDMRTQGCEVESVDASRPK